MNSTWCASPAFNGQVQAGITTISPEGLTPAQQLREINAAAAELIREQQTRWVQLRGELRENGIAVVRPDDLSVSDMEWARDSSCARCSRC